MANQNITTKETINQLNDDDTLLVVQNSKLRRISKKNAYGDEVSQLKEAIVEQTNNGYLSKNLANPNNFVIGKVVNYKDGSIESNSSYFISNYIAVKPNTTYTKQGFTQGGENWCYASDKSAISRIPSSGTFTTPSNAKYVILSGNTENIGQAMLEEGTVASSFIPYAYPNTEIINVKNSSIDLKMLGWTVPTECPIQNSYANGVFTQRVGRVDLGSLSWEYQAEGTRFHSLSISSLVKASINNSTIPNAFTTAYEVATPGDTWNIKNNVVSIGTNKAVLIRDTSYTDATTFKNSLQGQYLYYELATPITKNIDGNEVVSDLDAQGLLNKFDGKLLAGYYHTDGTFHSATTRNFSGANAIPCKPNDTVTIVYGKEVGFNVLICYYNGDTFIKRDVFSGGKKSYVGIAPANTTNIKFTVADDTTGHNTISTCYPIEVYINNVIYEINLSILATERAWAGNQLKFSLPKNGTQMYELTAMSTDSDCVKTNIIIRSDGTVSKKDLGYATTLTYDSDGILTVAFAKSSYWCYNLLKMNSYY